MSKTQAKLMLMRERDGDLKSSSLVRIGWMTSRLVRARTNERGGGGVPACVSDVGGSRCCRGPTGGDGRMHRSVCGLRGIRPQELGTRGGSVGSLSVTTSRDLGLDYLIISS
jgi:hypothetical protein